MQAEQTAYLRGRIAQVFDRGSNSGIKWTMTDANAVWDVLNELHALERRGRLRNAAPRGEDAQAISRAEAF